MPLDSVLLQTGNAALPNLINPFRTEPIVSNIQETHSFRIQDVPEACVAGHRFYKANAGEWGARESVFWGWGRQVTEKFFKNSHPHPASGFWTEAIWKLVSVPAEFRNNLKKMSISNILRMALGIVYPL